MKFIPTRVAGFEGDRGLAFLIILLAGIGALLTVPVESNAQALRSQVISLVSGWNAVYLEIDPVASDPAQLFAETPVGVVASYASPNHGAQFVRNPSADMLSTSGWVVWYAAGRPDAFLSTLHRIYGGKPYLIFASKAAVLQIAGSAVPERQVWTPNAYNFVGFSVASPGAPTFRQFFRGSAAHNHNKLYRLTNGTWRQVLNPGAESMRAGEAFWIYCDGRSDYPGPLEVSVQTGTEVMLSSMGGSQLTFRNHSDNPLSFSIEHLCDPDLPIPISTPLRVLDESTGGLQTRSVHFDAGFFQQDFPPLGVGKAIRFPMELRLQDAGPGVRHSLLKITTDVGTVTYIPVTASRDDL